MKEQLSTPQNQPEHQDDGKRDIGILTTAGVVGALLVTSGGVDVEHERNVLPGPEESAVLVIDGPADDQKGGEVSSAIIEKHAVNEAWARLFSEDPHAGELTRPEQVDMIGERVKELIDQGFSITEVSMQGFASDEDDSAENAGIGQGNRKNVDLANTRTVKLYPELKQEMEESGYSADIGIEGGIEDILTDSERGELSFIAKATQHEDVTSLIKQYNRDPSSLSKTARQGLDKILGSERKVEVTISAETEQAPIPENLPEGSKIEVVAQGEGEEVTTKYIIKTPVMMTMKAVFPAVEPLIEEPVEITGGNRRPTRDIHDPKLEHPAQRDHRSKPIHGQNSSIWSGEMNSGNH